MESAITTMEDRLVVRYNPTPPFIEGAFREWGHGIAARELADLTVGRGDIGNGFVPEGEALIEDTIADAFLRQFLPRPAEYDISATMSLSGDSISDAHPAQAGGIGVAPGANLRLENGVAILAAAQRTASRYTGPHRQGNGGCGEQETPHLQFRAAFGKRPRGLDERARRWNDRRHIEPERRQDGIESA